MMSAFSYHTIQSPAEGSFKDKGSKFLAFAYPVETEDEIKKRLILLKKQYFDARHHCYAWMLGPDKKHHRAFDDGEPNHSAGDPILGQIRSRNLTDVLVVVVRYFGGTKLGVGGLINAYKNATDDALQHAVIIEKEVEMFFTCVFDYPDTPAVMRLIKEYDMRIVEQDFTSSCTMVLAVSLKNRSPIEERFKLMIALGAAIKMMWQEQ
ncbi:MAG TPA: YigZ family protein [Ohtaekwangia sp.]|nr:YigZ family protein [Ohtaekwangia sp.]